MENIKYQNIKKALMLSEFCYDAVRAAIRVGISEKELYRVVSDTLLEKGGSHVNAFIGDFVAGRRTSEISGGPTDNKMKMGDLFILDLSVQYDNYWCDTCRTFFLGEPDNSMKKAYQTILKAQEVCALTVRAGVKASDVKEVAESFLKSQGYANLMPHHAGHSVGEEPYQKPAFEEGCDMLLQEGDVITLEPGLYFQERWGMRVENNYIVHEDHLENIFDYTRNIEDFIIKEM